MARIPNRYGGGAQTNANGLLFEPLGYGVEYLYVFNDWFLKDKYRDTLNYIEMMGCRYFFNEIPLEFLGL